ncbi:MAG: hypothetical protein R3E01_34320 [Pirellulaceae bacterium]|nr:hypothetical protein [Planctomycetales bacterium]
MEDVCELLNDLLVIENRSLPMYLASARPWSGPEGAAAQAELSKIAVDQRRIVDILGGLIVSRGGMVDMGEFPMEFTDLHDLSVSFVLPQIIRRQRSDIVNIQRIAEQLSSDVACRSIAEEALGSAKGHLELLEELASARTVA